MLKNSIAAAFGLSLLWLSAGQLAQAQQQAPIGHRQPTASDVPANDSIRGDPALSGQTAPPPPPAPSKGKRTRRARSDVDVILKTPNICSNCNQ